MQNLVELDIEVMIRIVSNSYRHHEIVDGNTPSVDIPETLSMNTDHFKDNELGIVHLHTDRLSDIAPQNYKTNFRKTNLQKYLSSRHLEVEEMGKEAYQMLIDDMANLMRGRSNHSIQSIIEK